MIGCAMNSSSATGAINLCRIVSSTLQKTLVSRNLKRQSSNQRRNNCAIRQLALVQSANLNLSLSSSLRSRQYLSSSAESQSPNEDEKPTFAGIQDCEWTYKLELISPNWAKRIPVYRVLGIDGDVKEASEVPQLSEDEIVSMYKTMVTINQMDRVLYDSQRQGRISFYMTSYGEEATHVGSAAALNMDDVIYAQYREVGVLLWRGFSLERAMNQCFGNAHDPGKGKQMPVHYGAPDLNFVTISSTLATQMPQGVTATQSPPRPRTS